MSDNNIIHGIKPIIPIYDESVGIFLYNHFSDNAEDVTYTDPGRNLVIKNKEVLKNSCLVALKLQELHLKNNDVVGLCTENEPEFLYVLLGCLYLGVTVSAFNPRYTKYELRNCLTIAKPKIIFCSKAVVGKLDKIREVGLIITVDSIDDQGHHRFFYDFISQTNDWRQFRPFPVNINETVAFILYSSGTTGLPKGVCLTHKNINALFACVLDPRYKDRYEGNVAMGVMPFFHSGGLFLMLANLIKKKEVIILKSFDPEVFVQILSERKVEILEGVPMLASFILKSSSFRKHQLFLKLFFTGGAKLNLDTADELLRRTQIKEIWQGYGMTELTFQASSPTVGNNKVGSCGQLCPYLTSKVVDVNTGKTLDRLQSGELCFKGPYLMKGYKNNETATKLIIDEDGWLHSGDVGYYDHDGYLFVTDRLKELIKYKGFQVSPTELETVLLSHPNILDAAVIGVQNKDVGELPMAFVVKNPSSTLTELEIQDYVAGRVSSQKKLRGGIVFINELPKTGSFKVMKSKLQSMLKSNL